MTRITRWVAAGLSAYSNSRLVQCGFRCYLRILRLATAGKRPYSLGKFEMNLDVSESEAMVLRRLGRFEPEVSDLLTSSLSEGDIYIDIGSNKGYHLLEAASVVGPAGFVIGFEPSPNNFEDLVANVDLNGFKNIFLNNLAVSDESKRVYLSYGARSGHGQISSIDGDVAVDAVSLDDFIETTNVEIERVRAVKIDVEGAEGAVLNGMSGFLEESDSCVIVVEVHDGGNLDLLRDVTDSFEPEWQKLTLNHWYIRF